MRNLLQRIENLFFAIYRIGYWLPVIWKDRWWDSSFLLRIMEVKLRYDADRYKRMGTHVGNDRRVRQIRTAAILCKRLDEQDYTTPWDKEFEQAGNNLWNYMENHTETMGSNLIVHTSRGYIESKRLSDASRWAIRREDDMRKQDLEYLCKLLQKHLFKWWD
jgi:hypothetical protein